MLLNIKNTFWIFISKQFSGPKTCIHAFTWEQFLTSFENGEERLIANHYSDYLFDNAYFKNVTKHNEKFVEMLNLGWNSLIKFINGEETDSFAITNIQNQE